MLFMVETRQCTILGLTESCTVTSGGESSLADDAVSQSAAMHKLEVHALDPTDDEDDVTSRQHSPVNMQHEPAVGAGTDSAVHALELARLRLSQDRADRPDGAANSSGELLDETSGQHDETNGIPLPMGNYKRSVRSLSDPVSSRRTDAAAQAQQRRQQQQHAAAGGFAVPVQHGLSQQLAASAGADVGAALERLLHLHTAQVCRSALHHMRLLHCTRMQNLCHVLLVAVMQHQLRFALHFRWRLCLAHHSCAAAWVWTCQCCLQPCSRTALAPAKHLASLMRSPCNKALQHQRMQPRRGLRLCPAPRQQPQHTTPSMQQMKCPPPLPAAQRPRCPQARSLRLCHLLAKALRLVSVVRAGRRKQTQPKPRSSGRLPGASLHI
jgi:hypothetical protein